MTIDPRSVAIVTVRVSPAGKAAGCAVGHADPPEAAAPPDAAAEATTCVGAAPAPDEHPAVAAISISSVNGTAAALRTAGRDLMRRPPWRWGTRGRRTATPHRGSDPRPPCRER